AEPVVADAYQVVVRRRATGEAQRSGVVRLGVDRYVERSRLEGRGGRRGCREALVVPKRRRDGERERSIVGCRGRQRHTGAGAERCVGAPHATTFEVGAQGQAGSAGAHAETHARSVPATVVVGLTAVTRSDREERAERRVAVEAPVEGLRRRASTDARGP